MKRQTVMDDFTIVDLFQRPCLDGLVRGFANDKYVFRAYPLIYRTWFYHYYYLYDQSKLLTSADEAATVKFVLSQRVIDAHDSAGRWSPLMAYVPLVFCSCLTGDTFFVGPGVFLIVLLYMSAVICNTPALYRYARLMTLPFRLGYFGVMLVRWAGLDLIGVIGAVLALLMFFADLLLGDLSSFFCYRLHCSYEVIQSLPNRVFVCKVKGASHLGDDDDKQRNTVSEAVSGIGNWARNMALVADLYGMLVELVPMQEEDWLKLYEEYNSQTCRIGVMGLDVYNADRPTQHSLHPASQMELEEIVEKEHKYMCATWKTQVQKKYIRGQRKEMPRTPERTIRGAIITDDVFVSES